MNRSVWVVLLHHDVDDGYQGTRLFETREAAEGWLKETGHRRDEPNEFDWTKPVWGEWEDYPEGSEYGGSLEWAAVYEQEVER